MGKCMVCGKEMYTAPASFKCFGCATGYKSSTPTSRPVVPSDCVPKADLRKLVVKYRDRQRHWTRWKTDKAATYETVADDLEKLLDGGE